MGDPQTPSTGTQSAGTNRWTRALTTFAYPVIDGLPVSGVSTGLVLKMLEPIWKEMPLNAINTAPDFAVGSRRCLRVKPCGLGRAPSPTGRPMPGMTETYRRGGEPTCAP